MVNNLALSLQISESIEDTVLRKQPSSSSENIFFTAIDNSEHREAHSQSSNSKHDIFIDTLGTNNFANQRIPLWFEKKLLDIIALNDEGYSGLEGLHTNLCDLTYEKIGCVLQIYCKYCKDKQRTPKIDKGQFKQIIISANEAHCLNMKALQEHMQKEVQQVLDSAVKGNVQQ